MCRSSKFSGTVLRRVEAFRDFDNSRAGSCTLIEPLWLNFGTACPLPHQHSGVVPLLLAASAPLLGHLSSMEV